MSGHGIVNDLLLGLLPLVVSLQKSIVEMVYQILVIEKTVTLGSMEMIVMDVLTYVR